VFISGMRRGVPRVRGDEPLRTSPHRPCGYLVFPASARKLGPVFPASAGMNRLLFGPICPFYTRDRVPASAGEGGKRTKAHAVFPASAGMNRVTGRLPLGWRRRWVFPASGR
jgi:hypothetical protein